MMAYTDSHPKFNRHNSWAPWMIKRAKSKSTPKAAGSKSSAAKAAARAGTRPLDSPSEASLNEGLPNVRHGLQIDGTQQHLFPSLLDNATQDGDMPLLDQLHQTIRSQIAPPASKTAVVISHDSDNDSVGMEPKPLTPASHPKLSNMTARSNLGGQQDDNALAIAEPVVSSRTSPSSNMIERHHQTYGSILDDRIAPIPMSLEPQNLAKHNRLLQDQGNFYSSDRISSSCLEPRSIQEMNERPDHLFSFQGNSCNIG
mmetsp:Transcript_42661/g.103181  ORF Transcript_42661/g.103181 Transcript_42661/m.103181 type:complete len:257 (+) Transcript_42661:333-1103(+)